MGQRKRNDLVTDPFLPFPPPERSIRNAVQKDWDGLRRAINQNRDVSNQVGVIAKKLDDVARDLAIKKPDDLHDWDRELPFARNWHQLNVDWLTTITNNFSAEADYWRELARKQYDIAQKLMLSGVNYLIIGHGTVAITCLNALVAERGQKYATGLTWAIWDLWPGYL